MKNQFKVGDKVYCSAYTVNICQIRETEYNIRIVQISNNSHISDIDDCGLTLCDDGKNLEYVNNDTDLRLCHATQENYELLSRLYPNVEFEKPAVRKESMEVIQAMLDDGWKRVPCKVSDVNESSSVAEDLVGRIDTDAYYFYRAVNYNWKYATPFDPKTGKIIIDYVDGEIVTE